MIWVSGTRLDSQTLTVSSTGFQGCGEQRPSRCFNLDETSGQLYAGARHKSHRCGDRR